MANNEWSNSRVLFSDMFSFSFEPEILTFLWGICAKKADGIQRDYRYLLPSSSSLLQIFVPHSPERSNFLSFLKNTITTGRSVVLVGFSSYGAFKVLQKLRYEGLVGIKDSVTQFANYLTTPKNLTTSNGLELALRTTVPKSSVIPSSSNLATRPSDLSLSNGGDSSNGTSHANTLHSRLNEINVPADHFSVTPINGEIATGDEDMLEVQGQYFGPVDQGIETFNPEMI
ncbi:uncharacterized protein LOC110850989 [Folsomia candida]|uniref:Uncharacterized protein n=1 Tax=Folsomia candida TaxID=158441 RepID=A0A226E766_FOLCA|nr:uncharacterized protein LOC110850989 [Folsomia candida]OXA52934.1 hypothetical protein Fcan01_12323 [Folsomia candida]